MKRNTKYLDLICLLALITFQVVALLSLSPESSLGGETAKDVEIQSTTTTGFATLVEQNKENFLPDREDMENLQVVRLTLPQYIQTTVQSTGESYRAIAEGLSYVATGFVTMPSEVAKAVDVLTHGEGTSALLSLILAVVGLYGAGLAAEGVVRYYTRKLRRRIERASPGNLMQKFLYNLILLGFGTLYFVVFIYSTIHLMVLLVPEGDTLRTVASGYLVPITRTRIGILLFLFLFSPHSSGSRLAPLTDYCAKQLFYVLSTVIIVSPLVARTIFTLTAMGLSNETYLALFLIEILIPAAILITMVWYNRAPLHDYIAANSIRFEPGSFNYWIAKYWHLLTILYISAMVIFRQVSLLMGKEMINTVVLSLISLPGVVFLDLIILSVLGNIQKRKEKLNQITIGDNSPDVANYTTNYIDHIHTGLRLLLTIGLILYLVDIWGIKVSMGQLFTRGVMSTFMTGLVGYFLWEYLKGVIDYYIGPEAEEGEELEEMGKGGSRKATLLTLLKKVIVIIIMIFSVLFVLSSLGVDIGPLLAGAGILGLAVGFGSQALVKDILSGVFFLIDDAFRIGDYVESGGLRGTVERISIRSLSLRHSRGMLQTIPYGSLDAITNFSRDWTAMKLEVRVPFDTDPEQVRKIIKKMGKRIAADENLAPMLLSPIKSQGVKEIDDSSLVMRIKFRCHPGDQFELRKEVFRQVREDFSQNGIEFAPKKVTVHIPNLQAAQATPEQLTHIAAAATEPAVTQSAGLPVKAN
jgi:small-conductance mechanosensitive channel